jgi:cbb3-type cytochrome oxidase subunit 3
LLNAIGKSEIFVSSFKYCTTNDATNNQFKKLKLKKMKNFLIAFVAGIFLALATTNGAYAQSANNFALKDNKQSSIKFNKSVFPEESGSVSAGTNAISAKALKSFKNSYKDASGEKWEKNEYGATARFNLDGIDNIIYYDKKGNWRASIKNYGENKLDRTVRGIVKSKYYDYKIMLVQEVETTATNGTPTYMVHIEGDNDFKIVRVSDDAMDVYEEYARQK